MKSIQSFLGELIRTPSQVAVDDLGRIVKTVRDHLDGQHIYYALVGAERKPSAIIINPPTHETDQVLLLDACLDTAPVGDLSQWQVSPFAATVKDGWMYGRGSADSKAAVAIFSELAKSERLTSMGKHHGRSRRVTVIFDCDEHSGKFGGIKAYTRKYGFPEFCAIGYPGNDAIVSGSRGFFRAVVTLRGHMGHAGSGKIPRELAMNKLNQLLSELEEINQTAQTSSEDFPLGPRASATWIRTGVRSFSVTPSKIECGIDLRLTPSFDPNAASALLDRILNSIAARGGDEHPSTVSVPNCWPAYKTPDAALLPSLLLASASRILEKPPKLTISGPSNIGNYLAMHGTEVLSGFGVDYENIHGPDERVRLSSISDVYAIYADTTRNFLSGEASHNDA